MNRQLQALTEAGQSIWLDNIHRGMFASGKLNTLIELGLRGMTSNPTIFEKAISSEKAYEDQLAALSQSEENPHRLFEALAVEDTRTACDEFRALFETSNGGDGFVSLEVSPLLVKDSQATLAAARRLWSAVDRPNIMIKIPGTPEGLPAITDATDSGININITLLFTKEQYEAAAKAVMLGLERRLNRGESVERVFSVASVFVSRIDSAVDKLLEEKVKKDAALGYLLGKAGIASTKYTYQAFKELFLEGKRFAALAEMGARVQRPLWGSTSTKNPAYPALMYVENLIGRLTVNTVPPATLDTLLESGRIEPDSIEKDLGGARATLDALQSVDISLDEIGQKLQEDGIKAFADSYRGVLAAIEYKRQQLKAAI